MSNSLQMSDPLETRASLIHRLPDSADVDAWDRFVDVYGPLVYRLARRKGLQPTDADDLVQEVLAAVSRSVETWLGRPDRGAFRAWLCCIARNTAINFLTRAKHRTLGKGGDDANQAMYSLPAQDAASAEFDAEYEREVFRWASIQVREMVTEKTWHAFHETAVNEKPVADVAQELQMTVGSVYIARSRVMARLKDFVQQLEDREQ